MYKIAARSRLKITFRSYHPFDHPGKRANAALSDSGGAGRATRMIHVDLHRRSTQYPPRLSKLPADRPGLVRSENVGSFSIIEKRLGRGSYPLTLR